MPCRRVSWFAGAVVVALAGVPVAEAQSAATGLLRRFVVVVGGNRSTFSGDDVEGADPRTGLLLGAGMFLPLSPSVGFQSELLYSMKGAASDDDGSGNEAVVKTNYLDVPLLLRFEVPTARSVKPFLIAGPSLGYQVGCDLTITSAGTTGTLSCSEFAELTGEPEPEKVDVALNLGGGIAFDMGGRALTLGLRFNQGLSSVIQDTDGKHRVLSFVGTLELPIGRR